MKFSRCRSRLALSAGLFLFSIGVNAAGDPQPPIPMAARPSALPTPPSGAAPIPVPTTPPKRALRANPRPVVSIPPLPPPNLSLPAPADTGPTATIISANSTSVRTHSSQGHFRLAGIGARETVNVRLNFPPSLAGTAIMVSSLDGGELNIPGRHDIIAPDGTASFQFKAGDQPGLYRVLLVASGNRSLLKFWVDDSKNPKANPPHLQPGI